MRRIPHDLAHSLAFLAIWAVVFSALYIFLQLAVYGKVKWLWRILAGMESCSPRLPDSP